MGDQHQTYAPGTVLRVKYSLLKSLDERPDGRICEVKGVIARERWRSPSVAEYRVELLALPVRAVVRQFDLEVIPDELSMAV